MNYHPIAWVHKFCDSATPKMYNLRGSHPVRSAKSEVLHLVADPSHIVQWRQESKQLYISLGLHLQRTIKYHKAVSEMFRLLQPHFPKPPMIYYTLLICWFEATVSEHNSISNNCWEPSNPLGFATHSLKTTCWSSYFVLTEKCVALLLYKTKLDVKY